ncbi:60S ribosomal protein L10a [Thelohanellus kitauei]|uniref:Large ribosomal subunit protein uL1 n=1 Tax=Thelohanellus kitauei TaxID=669202 RepID=A0A0C2NEF7_THEKT|nr:60S ribosomal protein L10a [Thelohanellus kitauei]
MSKLNKETVVSAISSVLTQSESKKRKFMETVELQVGLKNYDVQKDKRFTGVVKLKHCPRPNRSVCILGDQYHIDQAKNLNIPCMDIEELKKLNKDKKMIKKMAQKYDAFLASESIIKQMPRLLGGGVAALNRAGKFPTVVTHTDNLLTKIEEIKSSVKFQMKKTLCLGAAIGNVSMTKEQLQQNTYLSINFLVSLLKKNWQNVRSLHLKSTMGPPQRIY